MKRREFLKYASMGIAGGAVLFRSGNLLAGRMGGGGGGMTGGGGSGSMDGGVIDPPMGALFLDPPEAHNNSSEAGLVTVNLDVRQTPINVNGTLANLTTYNGHYPGPTIRIKQGDVLRVELTNSLPYTTQTNLLGHTRNVTNLHTHGWHVSPNAITTDPPVYADYVMYDLHPGETVIHEYDTGLEVPGGFHFYHPHRHGVSAEQYWAGLAGALILEDPTESPFNGMATHIMILKDISLSGSEPAPHSRMMDYMHGKEGNIIMVNGQVNPELRIQPGEIQRWRILNASNARWYRLKLSNHQLYLVGTDGHWLDKPNARSEILMAPGERVDVLVQASDTKGLYKCYSMPYSRMGNMDSAQITLLTMNVRGPRMSGQDFPTTIDPEATRLDIDTSGLPHQTLALSMGQGRGYINGISFQDMDHAYMVMSMVGSQDMPKFEVWTITNESGMDHPFHQHVDHAQVLAISGADPSYPPYHTMPAWKDTVLIPKWGSATLLLPVLDYDGMSMFHCHILEHEDIGMMGVWHRMEMM